MRPLLIRTTLWWGWWLASACASTPGPSPGAAPGDPLAPPSIAALPELAEDSGGDAPRTRQGLLAAREALQEQLPEPPADRSHASLQAWVSAAVLAWVEERRERIAHVRQRFELEGRPGPAERVVRDAVLALLHEDTAAVLSSLPEPAELSTEPEIGRIYREVLTAQAAPFVGSALLSYRACAEGAQKAQEPMPRWASFCQARLERLERAAAPR